MSAPPTGPQPSGAAGSASEPRVFGEYDLLKELGRGAQGVVWLAEHRRLHRKVALKMLTGAGAQSQGARDRFRREAELTSKFEHPGICGVHDFGEVDGLPYIAMQYVRGTTLASIVEKTRDDSDDAGRAPGSDTITIGGGDAKGGLEDVLRLVERAARALHVAHESGLVHRDIKPANIMVTLEGHPVLLDFGLARDLEAEGQGLTQSGQILGTPAYLAPEQIVASRGAVDRRTDVYALGVTLFECLTLKRPFESGSWDQLFHEILEGAPRNPRTLNPRIPLDLATVIEVAMDRDPARRYATAEALAEDLRRVRSFEPIQAKAAGPLTRLRKWARRDPGRAAAAAAVSLLVLSSAAVVVVRVVQRGRDLRMHLRAASEALVAADYVGAAIAVAKAQELDPESAEVVELKSRVERGAEEAEREIARRNALAEAENARTEADALRERYATTRREIDALTVATSSDRSGVVSAYAEEKVHADFGARERAVRQLEIAAERMLLSRSEALVRAERLESAFGAPSAATQSALAAFYLERWNEAERAGDAARAAAMRTAVESHDPAREREPELLGRGTLKLTVAPPQAELHLFRFEDCAGLREDAVVPRLVPVPTSGVGRTAAVAGGLVLGDACLVVRAVEPESAAARAGLAPGDLVLRCGDAPAAGALFVRDVPAASELGRAGVAPLTRIASIGGHAIQGRFDWVTHALAADRPTSAALVLAGGKTVECDPRLVSVVDALELVHVGPPVVLRLAVLRGGEAVALEIPAGEKTGMRCEVTANPLVLAPANRVAGGGFTADPGSYLVVARCAGFEDQRVPVRVPRRAQVDASVELLPAGAVPEGFVYVAPGPFVAGGDPQAFKPVPARTVEVPGFFIARKELTNAEWYEFVNDPETLALIAESKPGEHLYLPQDDRVLARRKPDGDGYEWDVYNATSAASPVLGLDWNDAHAYVEWRNARAAERGEPWRYDLPSEVEWEKAARGVDARAFPWGDRFAPPLTVCMVRKSGYLLDAPGGFEPRDESPYGVLDMAGSREEWLRDEVTGTESARRKKRGGHWSSIVESLFRCASRGEASPDLFRSSQGLRLVARRP